MRVYTQLTQGQRYQIEALLKTGNNQALIANALAVDKSTISRELKRNRGFRPKQADEKAMRRRYESSKTRISLKTRTPKHRPRKILCFKTPYELLFKKKTLLTVH